MDILECSNDKLEAYFIGFYNNGYNHYENVYKYTNGEKSFTYYVNGKGIEIIN